MLLFNGTVIVYQWYAKPVGLMIELNIMMAQHSISNERIEHEWYNWWAMNSMNEFNGGWAMGQRQEIQLEVGTAIPGWQHVATMAPAGGFLMEIHSLWTT